MRSTILEWCWIRTLGLLVEKRKSLNRHRGPMYLSSSRILVAHRKSIGSSYQAAISQSILSA